MLFLLCLYVLNFIMQDLLSRAKMTFENFRVCSSDPDTVASPTLKQAWNESKNIAQYNAISKGAFVISGMRLTKCNSMSLVMGSNFGVFNSDRIKPAKHFLTMNELVVSMTFVSL